MVSKKSQKRDPGVPPKLRKGSGVVVKTTPNNTHIVMYITPINIKNIRTPKNKASVYTKALILSVR